MNLKQLHEAFDYRISGGSEYGWSCYGYNVRCLDFESDYAYATLVFDTKTSTVYSADISSTDNTFVKAYRWQNPEHLAALLKESNERGVDNSIAWDDVKWIDLEVEEDFLEKAKAMFNGEDFDTRVVVPLDLDDTTILMLALAAHKRDITINKMVEVILQQVIDQRVNEKQV